MTFCYKRGEVEVYLPYLRGKQFELIALRDLVEKGLLSDKVIPIIEPIKLTSTLKSTLAKFVENEKKIGIIFNPQISEFNKEYQTGERDPLFEKLLSSDFVIKAHIMNENSDVELKQLESDGQSLGELLVLHIDKNHLTRYQTIFKGMDPLHTMIPDDTLFRRTITSDRILLEDRFPKLVRNSDYKDRDEFFSADHLFYKNESYVGYSDYSIVGKYFNEGGFAPYAVAIHIVYFNEENHLRVKSFVSDSNDDIRDPAKKFYEAVTHLVDWLSENQFKSDGLNQFIGHYQNQTYPGLGTVKKLSIMHHLELMSNYLDLERLI